MDNQAFELLKGILDKHSKQFEAMSSDISSIKKDVSEINVDLSRHKGVVGGIILTVTAIWGILTYCLTYFKSDT